MAIGYKKKVSMILTLSLCGHAMLQPTSAAVQPYHPPRPSSRPVLPNYTSPNYPPTEAMAYQYFPFPPYIHCDSKIFIILPQSYKVPVRPRRDFKVAIMSDHS